MSSQRGELGISQGVAEPSSTWTAHFDTFCMQEFTCTPALVSQDDGGDSLEAGLARSWREDGVTIAPPIVPCSLAG